MKRIVIKVHDSLNFDEERTKAKELANQSSRDKKADEEAELSDRGNLAPNIIQVKNVDDAPEKDGDKSIREDISQATSAKKKRNFVD